MQNIDSNKVLCVALNKYDNWGGGLTPVDIVEKKGHYFFPMGTKGWPKEPPNYLAVRYDGKLKGIYHVEDYSIDDTPDKLMPQLRWGKFKDGPHYILELGKKFMPDHEVPTGKLWSNGRFKVMLDTLFTCKTIKEATDVSNKRDIKQEK